MLQKQPTSKSAKKSKLSDKKNNRNGAQASKGVSVKRHFTTSGQDPFDTVEWEQRDASITGADGQVFFEQKGVEFPVSWSQTATNVVVQKYFRGTLGTAERERSVKHMISRVADTIYKWGRTSYFKSDDDAWAFRDELVHLLVHQKMAFNSPVWFNVGVEELIDVAEPRRPEADAIGGGVKRAAAACTG